MPYHVDPATCILHVHFKWPPIDAVIEATGLSAYQAYALERLRPKTPEDYEALRGVLWARGFGGSHVDDA